MADALLFAGAHAESRSRARIDWNFHLFVDLLAPALLLGLLRLWSSAMAPRLGVYFTAEALLIAYAYFAVVRGVHLNARSYDWSGRYSRERALKAGQDFHRGLRRYWVKIALVVLPVLMAALMLDALTGNNGVQYRPNIHLSILFVEIMVWARYGAAVVIASARWSPPQPAAFNEARELAARPLAARSFALTNIAFGVAALAAVAAYKWGGPLMPSARAEFIGSAVLFTALALLALWLQCRWTRTILPRIGERTAFEGSSIPVMKHAA
jgi:hypothetical protein